MRLPMHDVAFAFHFGTLHRFALKAVEDVVDGG
jgi:hypothetical protein